LAETTRYCPEYNYSPLRGRIKEKCGTEGSFASKIGRTQNFITKVWKHKTYFSQTDIDKAAGVLEIPSDMIGYYFFTI